MKNRGTQKLVGLLACLLVVVIIVQNQRLDSIEELENEENFTYDLTKTSNASQTSDRKTRRLPGALIIGSRKCGTRALLKFLQINPSVQAAKSEVHFFDRPTNYKQGLDWYRAHFPESSSYELTIEKSPAYFVAAGVPSKVRTMNPNIKLVLILRNPVTRLISDFSQIVANRLDPSARYPDKNTSKLKADDLASETLAWSEAAKEFEALALRRDGHINENWRPIRLGMYSRYLESWLKLYPIEQIHLVDGEAMIKTPYEELRKLEQFLNLNHTIKRSSFVFEAQKGFFCVARNVSTSGQTVKDDTSIYKRKSVQADCLSRNKGRRHVQVRAGLVKRLGDFYAPYNEYLYSMTGKDFGWI